MLVPPYPSFPIYALPTGLRAAVQEIHDHTKAPIPLIVAAALAPLSIASQGQYNVRSVGGTESPVSIYLLVVGVSGERKTSVDYLFRKPVNDFEVAHKGKSDKALVANAPLQRVWKAKARGTEKAIESASAKGKPTDELTRSLVALFADEPKKPPPAPVLVYADTTTGSLQSGMHDSIPSAGLISSEAALVMGGNATIDMAFYNMVWDGIQNFPVVRKAKSFALREPRLTISWMAQPGIMRRFLEKKAQQVRDIGLLARMLIAFPESTQGTRFNHDTSPPVWDALLKHNSRISILLETYYEHFLAGKPKIVLGFTSQADQVRLRFYNAIELQIGKGNLFEDIRDHASKITENLARVAALFHIAEGYEGDIDANTTEYAAEVCKWYVMEFFRLFGAPDEMSQQHQLKTQLVADLTKLHLRHGVTGFLKTQLYQLCHPSLREKKTLEIALHALSAEGLIHIVPGSYKKTSIWLTSAFFQHVPGSVPMQTQAAPQHHRGVELGLYLPRPDGMFNSNGNGNLVSEDMHRPPGYDYK